MKMMLGEETADISDWATFSAYPTIPFFRIATSVKKTGHQCLSNMALKKQGKKRVQYHGKKCNRGP